MSDRQGVPPECIINDDVVKQIREQRQQTQAQAQQQQQKMEQMQAGASAAKDLSGAEVGGSNALEQLLSTPAANQRAA